MLLAFTAVFQSDEQFSLMVSEIIAFFLCSRSTHILCSPFQLLVVAVFIVSFDIRLFFRFVMNLTEIVHCVLYVRVCMCVCAVTHAHACHV